MWAYDCNAHIVKMKSNKVFIYICHQWIIGNPNQKDLKISWFKKIFSVAFLFGNFGSWLDSAVK